MNTAFLILGSVLLVSLLSFVGVLAIAVREDRLKKLFSFFIPLAVGALLGDAFFHLIPESFESIETPSVASALIILGIVTFFFLEQAIRLHHHAFSHSADDADHASTRGHLGPLILISDGIHNFLDGIIIGVSYLAGIEIGIATTIAIMFHEIPQEVGDYTVLVYAGYKKMTALVYNFFAALMAFGGATLVLIFGSLPERIIQGVIPFAAGVFIYIAASDLVPELQKKGYARRVPYEVAGLGCGLLVMYFLLYLD